MRQLQIANYTNKRIRLSEEVAELNTVRTTPTITAKTVGLEIKLKVAVVAVDDVEEADKEGEVTFDVQQQKEQPVTQITSSQQLQPSIHLSLEYLQVQIWKWVTRAVMMVIIKTAKVK